MQAHLPYSLPKGIGEYLSYVVAGGVDARVYGCAVPWGDEAAAYPLPRVPLAVRKQAPVAYAWQASNVV